MTESELKGLAEIAHKRRCLIAALRDHDARKAPVEISDARGSCCGSDEQRAKYAKRGFSGFYIVIGGAGRGLSVFVEEDQIWQGRSLRNIAQEAYTREIDRLGEELSDAGVELEDEPAA